MKMMKLCSYAMMVMYYREIADLCVLLRETGHTRFRFVYEVCLVLSWVVIFVTKRDAVSLYFKLLLKKFDSWTLLPPPPRVSD